MGVLRGKGTYGIHGHESNAALRLSPSSVNGLCFIGKRDRRRDLDSHLIFSRE